MDAHNLQEALEGSGEVEFRRLAPFNEGEVGVFWSSSGVSPWERHPDDEELLHVFEGQVEIEILTDDGSVITLLKEGSVCIVPRGKWHRHRHGGLVKEMYVTPGQTEMSFADDPRSDS